MTKRCKSPQLWIKPQDKDLFQYLHQVKVATSAQINRDVYRYDKTVSLYKRLSKLKRCGYLTDSYHNELPMQKVLSLTEKGFKDFVADGTERLVELRSQAVMHDLALVDIRQMFLRSEKVSRFYTENELKTWNSYWESADLSRFIDMHCDAAIEARLNSGNVFFAIEFEATRKLTDRVEDLIQRYYRNDEIPAVLYICGSTEILDLFKRVEEKHFAKNPDRKRGKFFYKLFHELRDDSTLCFTDISGNSLRIGGIENGRMAV